MDNNGYSIRSTGGDLDTAGKKKQKIQNFSTKGGKIEVTSLLETCDLSAKAKNKIKIHLAYTWSQFPLYKIVFLFLQDLQNYSKAIDLGEVEVDR